MKIQRIAAAVLFMVVAGVLTAHALTKGWVADDDDEFEFKGIVQSLPNTAGRIGDWMVGGRTVHVSSFTRIDQEERPISVGVLVEIEGLLRPDGSVDAKKIKVEDDDDGEFEFKGVIQSFPSGLIGNWLIGGRTVHVTTATRIEVEDLPIAVGAVAEVEGFLRPDGSVDAAKIEIENDQEEEEEFEFKGMIQSFPSGLIGNWVISGRTVHVTLATRIEQENGMVAVGATVKVEGFLRSDGSVDAKKIEVKSSVEGARVNFTGTITSLPSGLIGDWHVAGRTVRVRTSTRIKQKKGPVGVGVVVKVKGIQLADGTIEAEMIQVKKS
jgi:primosomal replication protein N